MESETLIDRIDRSLDDPASGAYITHTLRLCRLHIGAAATRVAELEGLLRECLQEVFEGSRLHERILEALRRETQEDGHK